jgi:hypothetical protein
MNIITFLHYGVYYKDLDIIFKMQTKMKYK